MDSCYVCLETIDLEKTHPYVCHRSTGNGMEYRHLWHGVPGITRAVGGGGGFVGYAQTLEDARRRAEYYINNNPYAAPEVIEGEMAVLKAIEQEELHG